MLVDLMPRFHAVLAVILAANIAGCGKDHSTQSSNTATTPAASRSNNDQTANLLSEVNKFQEFEKAMRPYGVDVEDKWEFNNGVLGPATRINLADRSGDGIDEQISIIHQYIATGTAIQEKHKDLLQGVDADASADFKSGLNLANNALGYARHLLNLRLKLAIDAASKLTERRRKERSEAEGSLQSPSAVPVPTTQ